MKEYDHIDIIMIADTMQRHGGGFVRKLGGLVFSADLQNKKKLIEAFPEYFQDYYDKAVKWGYTKDYENLREDG